MRGRRCQGACDKANVCFTWTCAVLPLQTPTASVSAPSIGASTALRRPWLATRWMRPCRRTACWRSHTWRTATVRVLALLSCATVVSVSARNAVDTRWLSRCLVWPPTARNQELIGSTEGALQCVVTALRRHPRDASVVTPALTALLELTQSGTSRCDVVQANTPTVAPFLRHAHVLLRCLAVRVWQRPTCDG